MGAVSGCKLVGEGSGGGHFIHTLSTSIHGPGRFCYFPELTWGSFCHSYKFEALTWLMTSSSVHIYY